MQCKSRMDRELLDAAAIAGQALVPGAPLVQPGVPGQTP